MREDQETTADLVAPLEALMRSRAILARAQRAYDAAMYEVVEAGVSPRAVEIALGAIEQSIPDHVEEMREAQSILLSLRCRVQLDLVNHYETPALASDASKTQAAWDEGYFARIEGSAATPNTFDEVLRESWLAGWRECDAQLG